MPTVFLPEIFPQSQRSTVPSSLQLASILYRINAKILVNIFLICYSEQMKKKKHQVFPHFSVEVLKQRYRECECPRERTHCILFGFLLTPHIHEHPGKSLIIVGCTADWVRKLLKCYNAAGKEALRDKRKNNGRRRFLDETQQAALEAALSAPPADGGLWTGPNVAAWISERLQRHCKCRVRLEVSQTPRLDFTDTSSTTSDICGIGGTAGI